MEDTETRFEIILRCMQSMRGFGEMLPTGNFSRLRLLAKQDKVIGMIVLILDLHHSTTRLRGRKVTFRR